MSVHIEAKAGEIAETVLLPGDPLRAKWIAETFLENAVCYNKVRNMFGYTGTYNGKRVSVQGTGMGIPSLLIYTEELITEYGAKNLIRVGSAGSYQKDIKIRDIVLALSASTNSGLNSIRFNGADYAPTVSFKLLKKALAQIEKMNVDVKAGNIMSTDVFYEDNFDDYKKWADFGVLCAEMETSGLYTIAAKHKVDALSLLTISDNLVTKEQISSKERERSLKTMIEIALNII